MNPLAQHITWYLIYLAARPASPRTIANYRSVLARLARFAAANGCTTAEGLTADLVRAAAADCMAEGARAIMRGRPTRSKGNEATANLMVVAARGLVRALTRTRGVAGLCDLRSVDAPRVPKRLQPRVSIADFVRLEAALDRRAADGFLHARDRALVLFLFETGLRAAEACRLDLGDVDLVQGTINVQAGKGRKPRQLGIADPHPDAHDGGEPLRRLRAYLAERAQLRGAARNRAFWLGVRGRRLNPWALRTILRDLCAEAGVSNLPVHAFRRGWFTAAYRAAPADLPILSARMGWSADSGRMVAVYTRGALMSFASEPRPLVSRMS